MTANNFLDHIKQAQAIVAAVLPFLSAKIEIVLPFLNPQIPEELWVLTAICTILASLLGYNLSCRARTGRESRKVAIAGFVVFGLSLLAMIVLVFGQALAEFPRTEDSVIRISFITLFVGTGLSAGWLGSIILPLDSRRSKPKPATESPLTS